MPKGRKPIPVHNETTGYKEARNRVEKECKKKKSDSAIAPSGARFLSNVIDGRFLADYAASDLQTRVVVSCHKHSKN